MIHADDVGMAASINRATFDALRAGWVTSASVMVGCRAFEEVADHAGGADLGVHLTLTCETATGRWGPVAAPARVPSLVDRSGRFWPDAETVARGADPREAEIELRAQIEKALDAGLSPSHLDSHMFVLFRSPALRAVLDRVSRSYDIPAVNPFRSPEEPDTALGPRVTLVSLVDLAGPAAGPRDLASSVRPGLSQCIVHCGYDDEELRATAGTGRYGSAWRQRDMEALGGEIGRALAGTGIELTDWARETRRRSGSPATEAAP